MRRLLPLFLLLVVGALSGCQVRNTVDVNVNGDGSGSVAVTAKLDSEAAAAVPDLATQLQTGDLVKAGWSIDGPSKNDDGGTTVTARHGFASPEEATQLLRQLSGNGPPFTGFRVQQDHGLRNVETTFTGSIDLRNGLESYGDLGLTQSLGSRLGFDAAEIQRSLGVDWAKTFPLDVVVHLPGGNVTRVPATGNDGAWSAAYGTITPVSATASGPNGRPLFLFIFSAATFVLAILVLLLWKSPKYLPAHRNKSNGVRARDLLDK